MRRYQVITTTPDGLMEKFIQPAQNARQATGIVKSFYFPGRPVKTTVKEIAAG